MATDEKDFLYGDSDYLCSLNKFVGKKVVDVIGYPSDPFGGTPVFVISQLLFEDGTTIYVDGEHDVAYLSSTDKLNNMNEETLQSLVGE